MSPNVGGILVDRITDHMMTMLAPNDLHLGKTIIGKPLISMGEESSTITVVLEEDLTEPEVAALLAHCVMATPTGYETDVTIQDETLVFVLKVKYDNHTRTPEARRSISTDDETHARLRLAADALVKRLGR